MSEGEPNPARPPPGTVLCALSELTDPGTKGFRFRENRKLFAGFVLLFEGELRGYVDSCPHAGWPLAAWEDRYLTREKDLILCGGHAALFRPLDGACVAGPCMGTHLTPWPVGLEGDQIVTL
jgi:nitrite reductase/ring-hydroxylating ferredoxin subunit